MLRSPPSGGRLEARTTSIPIKHSRTVSEHARAAPEASGLVMRRSAPDDSEPIAAAEAGRLLAPLEPAAGLLLAVSGGPDSVALMLLVAGWANGADRPPVQVATVDHGLRPESAAEAGRVGAWARAVGLSHATLVWRGVKPATRLQERARDARYALLSAHARAIGASHIVLAHHADDEAETVLFRLVRGSGIDGLAAMPLIAARGDLLLARPFIAVPKARLVATCLAAGHDFVDDASNADERFARVRLRRLMPRLADEGLDREVLLRLGRRAARAGEALDRIAAAVGEGLAPVRHPHRYSADWRTLSDVPAEIALRVLRDEIGRVAGAAVPLRLDRLERLAGRISAALARGRALKATLAGTVVTLDVQGKAMITRETTRRRGREPLH